MLEPYEGRLSRTVLRREGGSNPLDLSDNSKSNYCVLNEIWFSWCGIFPPITYWDLWFYRKLGTLPWDSGIIPISVSLNLISEANCSSPCHFLLLLWASDSNLRTQGGFFHFVFMRLAFCFVIFCFVISSARPLACERKIHVKDSYCGSPVFEFTELFSGACCLVFELVFWGVFG